LRIKGPAAWAALFAALVSLAVLAFLDPDGRRRGAGNLLLVSPVEDFVFDPQKLDRLYGEGFLVSYEIRRQLRASTGFAACPVTVIGTNSLYPLLVPCPPERGSFFTAAAENERSGHAVLNRAAAGRLFGALSITGKTFRMDGELWLVCGIVDDGEDENPQVYVPSSRLDASLLAASSRAAAIRGEGPRSLLFLVNSNGNDGDAGKGYAGGIARVKDALKPLGAGELSHRFYDLSSGRGLRLGIALRTLACALAAVCAGAWSRGLGTGTAKLRGRVLRPAFLAIGIILALRPARWILNAALRLADSPRDIVSGGEFPALLAAIRAGNRAEIVALTVFLAALGFLVIRQGQPVQRAPEP
jgi:hypothetical protein